MPSKIIGVFCAESSAAGEQPITAHDRYLQRREWIAPYILEERIQLFILSAVYGLIEVEEKVPYIDHRLMDDEVSDLVAVLTPQLRIHHVDGVSAIRFYTTLNPIWAPYRNALKYACHNVSRTSAREGRIRMEICQLFD